MATVYSLIAFGGKDGLSFTGNATTNQFTIASGVHGIRSGVALPVAFKSGTLPTVASGAGTGTEVFRDINDTKNRVTATVDSSGNRTAITRDAT